MIISCRLHLLLSFAILGLLVRQTEAGQVCGDVGTHNYTGTTYYMGNFFFKAQSTFALCADVCKNDYPRCKSFRYSYYSDADAQYCEFFPDWLEAYFVADNSQPYYYYDVDCAFPTYAVTETQIQFSTTTIALSTTTSVSVNVTTATLTSTTTTTATDTATQTQQQLLTTTATVSLPITMLVPTTQTVRSTVTATTTTTATATVTRSPMVRGVPGPTVYVTVFRTTNGMVCRVSTATVARITSTSISTRFATLTSRFTTTSRVSTTIVRPTTITRTATTTRTKR